MTDPEDYISLGLNNFSIPIHKNSYNTLFLLTIILIGFLFITIIIVSISVSYNSSHLSLPSKSLQPTVYNPILHSNIGSVNDIESSVKFYDSEDGSYINHETICKSVPTAEWNGTKCICKPPFFGPSCNREKHKNNYFSVGVVNENLEVKVIKTIRTHGKSFTLDSSESCSDHCDKMDECIGFIYKPTDDNLKGTCTLLKDNIIVPKNIEIPFSYRFDSTLYLKSVENLHFIGRVFIAEFVTSLPPRFWLVNETKHYKQLNVNEIAKLNFIPNYVKCYGNCIGIYCKYSFVKEDIKIIMDRGENSECYIHRPNTRINLSPDWEYNLPIYVVYLEI